MNSFRRVVRALRMFSRNAESELGVSGAQLFVLQALSGSPKGRGSSINELAAQTLTHQSSVSVVVSRLIRKGLARRSRNPRDGRKVEVSLTEKGARLILRVPVTPQSRLVSGMRRLSPKELDSLARSLERLLTESGLSMAPAPMMFEEPS